METETAYIVTPEEKDSSSIEEENQIITEAILEEYPTFFQEIILDDGSNAALFTNNARVKEEDKELLPPYEYIAVSKHGLTQFNCSYSPTPLEWERTKKAILQLIEISCGEEVKNLLISHWHPFHRIRKTKGLLKLKKNIKTVLVTGVNLAYEVKDFYELILKQTSLGTY